MSLFCENNNLKSREIKIDYFNNFTYLDKKYKLKFIKNLYRKKYIIVKLYKLYECEVTNTYTFIKDIVCKIIYKSTIDDNDDYIDHFNDEIDYYLFLENNIKNFKSNVLFYYINNCVNINLIEYVMFFDYLGITLEKFDINKLNFIHKIKLVLDLLEQCIELNQLSLYHSDIKPENICIQRINEDTNQDISESQYKLSLIDFGILYGEKEYFNLCEYNTTITSGSPEYYDINNTMNYKNILFPKDIFDKSQHFAVAGIIFGIFVNNTNLYFNEVWKIIIHNLKYSKINFDNCDILSRLSPFKNTIIIESIQNFVLSYKISEEYNKEGDFIKNILTNMLDIDYNKRLKFEELKIYFENKLNEFI
jgi:serine/threonine protein kinase